MSFQSGRVSFSRFLVNGKAPAAADENLLDILAQHAFRETEIGTPQEIESGWVTGEHIYDTRFTYEKNIFGPAGAAGAGTMLLFAIRIDTNTVPADIKRAIKQMNEQAAAEASHTGHASKQEKKDAREQADEQIRAELAAGRYRRPKMVPVLWDLSSRMIYCGAGGNTVAEQLAVCMRRSFDVEIEPLSSGALAGELMHALGGRRDFEDLRPSPFTLPPAQATADHEDAGGPRDLNIPAVPWAYASNNTRDFLGNEWLIWLWWIIENHEGLVTIREERGRSADIAIHIDKMLDSECAWGATGKQTLKGPGPSRLPEAAEAMAAGKWPRKATLIVADTGDGAQWELTLHADRWQVSGSQLPKPDGIDPQTAREAREYRLVFTTRLAAVLDGLFGAFLKERTASTWPTKRDKIRQWITGRRRGARPATPRPAEEYVADHAGEDVIARI